MPSRLLVPASSLLWSLQFALLTPALALILATLYSASTSDIGWTLAIYNTGGFLAALLIPAWVAGPPLATAIIGLAGGRGVLWTIVGIAVLNIATTVLLGRAGRLSATSTGADAAADSTTDPASDVPAGTSPGDGPSVQGAAVGAGADEPERAPSGVPAGTPQSTPSAPTVATQRLGRLAVVLVVAAVTLLQTTNATAVSFLSIYAVDTLGIAVMWAGIALGLAAGLEIPALVAFGRIGDRYSNLSLMSVGAIAGIAYYAAMTVVTGPAMLLALQILNAIAVATVAGIGMTLFQEILPGAGFSTGLFMNTRRIGAVISGPLIALGALEPLGQRGVFAACAVLTLVGLLVMEGVRRSAGRQEPAS